MQKNPYEVLGININASDEEIKNAYRQLARQYQAEDYDFGPLSNIAKQKMAELDEAYDFVMQQRRGNSGAGNAKNPFSYGQPKSDFPDIRAKIFANRIDDAEVLLDGILPDSRGAEWHFLKGLIAQKRGWFDEAEHYFSEACTQDPACSEFAAAYNNMRHNRQGGYRTAKGFGTGKGTRQCSACDICSGLLCADCICECLGCDCIPCC